MAKITAQYDKKEKNIEQERAILYGLHIIHDWNSVRVPATVE